MPRYAPGSWVPPGVEHQRKLRALRDKTVKQPKEVSSDTSYEFKSYGDFIVALREVLGLDPYHERFRGA